MSTDPKHAILARITAALDGRATPSREAADLAWQSLPRLYQHTVTNTLEERIALLEDRLRDYDADVTETTPQAVATTIARVLADRGDRPTLVPPGFPASWLPSHPSLVEDLGLTTRQLDHFDGVLTTATLAIAETGTLVLQNVPGQGRRAATLVPDFHLCVVAAADIVTTVPEAFLRLGPTATLPTTFVSGPSATADIEMTRIKGVHGPRFLHVVLVRPDPAT